MKKIISVALLLALCIACFAGCAPKEDANLNAAKEYLAAMYEDAGVKTTEDYTVVSQVMINNVAYPITWTADVAEDMVKITAGEKNTTVIDINETPSEDVNYKLTATIKNEDGLSVSVSFDHMIPKTAGAAEIVDMAYALESGDTLDGVYTLKGVISLVKDAWSSQYKNITVDIQVAGKEDKPIRCYRLAGEGAENLKLGDTITVKGSLTNYSGIIEFAQGCELLAVEAGAGDVVEEPGYDPTGKTQDEIVDAAYELEDGKKMAAEATLTGVITSVDTEWSEDYGNITVTIACTGKEDKPIQCFRLKGDGAENLKVGDTITVKGELMNYSGTIEFNSGCQLQSATAGDGTTPPATDNTPSASNPPATNIGASVTFDFSDVELDKDSKALDDAASLEVFNAATTDGGLVSVTTKNVYRGSASGGTFENQGGFIKVGKSKENGVVTMTFGKKVAKVEVLCHGWKTAGGDKVSVNGGDAQDAPVPAGTLTFDLDGSSETVKLEVNKRAYVYKIIVTFA